MASAVAETQEES